MPEWRSIVTIKNRRPREKMGKNDSVATEWKKRENISFIKTHGEQGEVDLAYARSCIQNHHRSLPKIRHLVQDETGFSFRELPENMYAFINDKARETKTSKEL